jgi:hypothetical protein
VSVWVWIVFLVLAAGIAVLAVRISRHAREDPFADVPRDEGTSMLAPRERAAERPAPDATPPPTEDPHRRTSLEERLKTAAAARAARAIPATVPAAEPEPVAPPSRRATKGPDILPLDPARRSIHEQRWREISEAISRTPASAFAEADAFVREVMAERGFPTDADDEAMTEAAVAHPDVMDPFRLATAIATKAAAGGASEEELRRGSVHVRDVVVRLFADDPARST